MIRDCDIPTTAIEGDSLFLDSQTNDPVYAAITCIRNKFVSPRGDRELMANSPFGRSGVENTFTDNGVTYTIRSLNILNPSTGTAQVQMEIYPSG